ncbi:Heparan sulfate glucosamine 3-O-sulfotransferase 3A1 [Holothuria leucospilota]|uniref:Heparan sulfate glucosamine 3-O-sulfotransferase 3A1 n=1 Tax=Holothuria leucospilota TaxID=206669 RepID=A0A9Q1CMP1_HOLLE|nr:Heparan sulfate glucosamine 3-O-sulfotransferase 3A1 [Holothuria leucospilota]
MKEVEPSFKFQNISWDDAAKKILRDEGYESRLPDVINIGAKKAGTTVLMFYLKFHPQIQISSHGQEVHYFDWHYDKGIKWYESQFNLANKHQLVYDKTPRYFITKSAPCKIRKDISGKLRFILCVRDPVSRLISDFHFSKSIRSSRGWRQMQTAESETKRLKDEILTANFLINESSPYVYTSDYATHFQEWLKEFDREQFLIIENDEMRSDLLGELRKVETFLGIDPYFTEDMFVQENRCLKHEGELFCSSFISDKRFPLPTVDEGLEKMLRDYFRPRNEEFERLTGRSYKWTNL